MLTLTRPPPPDKWKELLKFLWFARMPILFAILGALMVFFLWSPLRMFLVSVPCTHPHATHYTVFLFSQILASITGVLSSSNSDSTILGATCNPPTTIIQDWSLTSILPSSSQSSKPLPATYSLKLKHPHRLSLIDIDSRDMRLGVYVDGHSLGVTTDFEVDKDVQCDGSNWVDCLNKGFSAAALVIPKGKHEVKVEWVGKGLDLIHLSFLDIF